jgi:4-hydroxy-2-oxoheptanedioate aldolase
MNLYEKKMVDALKELKEGFAVVGVKAEFEAEGTRTDELMRLKEVCMAADLSLTLKIGGCEAIRDMLDARATGVNHLVAPMVETPFALRKYLKAIDMAFPQDEQEHVEFLINVETLQTVNNFDDMLAIPEIDRLDGIVVGRSDLVGSMGIGREVIDSDQILAHTLNVLAKARERNMTCVVGGTITADSIPFLRRLSEPQEILDRFETRKVCFKCPDSLGPQAADGIKKALHFELLWLENKSSFNHTTQEEDHKRISTLRKRLQVA